MEIKALLEQTDKLIEEIDSYRPIDPTKHAEATAKIKLEWTYHSNAIEGNSLTFGETRALFLNGTTAKDKPLKDHLDIKGHNNVIDELAAFLEQEEELTEAGLRAMHQLLLVESYEEKKTLESGVRTSRTINIGQYKQTPNHVETSTGEIHYFTAPENVSIEMANLLSWYRQEKIKKDIHPIILATYVHHKFVAIHPFDDGNGRMARILMNLVLMEADYPPAVIKLDRKASYISALERANAGEFSNLIEIIAEAVIESAEIFLRAAKGESVGDLLDADKEMALLLQELDTKYASSNVEITNISQKNIIENLIVPICNEITPRLQQLNKYFGSHTMHVTVKHGQTGLITESMLSELKNLIFQKIGDKKVYEIMFYYRGSTYIHNPHNKFHVSLTFLFTDTDYSVIAFVPPKRKLTLFTGTYDVDVAPEDTKDLTKKVMENIINGFRHISKEKPSSDIAKS